MKKAIFVLAALFALTVSSQAQSKDVDYYSAPDLRRVGHELAKQAAQSPDGIATKNLETSTNHFTMLSVRIKTGGAEVHQHYSDFFIVVGGEAILITGGKVLDPKVTGDGETRGSALSGGCRRKLREGDIVHIPPNKSHRLLIAPGKALTYFVIKVRE
jgi:mannose-6-phosphate isomerase-like protein (cupin superfamily)